MRQLMFWIGLLLVIMAMTACGTTAEESTNNQGGTIPDTISCEVYYRADLGQSFRDSILSLSTVPEQSANTASAEFNDMGFEATFLSDAGEGKSLSVVVTDLTAGIELTRGLYQFDPQAGLRDQFIGGHGFTGLAYVFHPASGSEMQYFCRTGA
jgi:hypothetical protein